MKKYKHSVKSGNTMKLAAVASAAIMIAPVALNSVSAFAGTETTPTTTTDAAASAATIAKLQAAVDAANEIMGTDAAKNATNTNITGTIAKLKNQVAYSQAALDGTKYSDKYNYSNGVTEDQAQSRYSAIMSKLTNLVGAHDGDTQPLANVSPKTTTVLNAKAADDKAAADKVVTDNAAAAAKATAKEALHTALKTSSDYYSQNITSLSVSENSALSKAISDANGVYMNDSASQDDFKNATANLSEAVEAAKKAIADSKDNTAAAALSTLKSHMKTASNKQGTIGITQSQSALLGEALNAANKVAKNETLGAKEYADATVKLDAAVKSIFETTTDNNVDETAAAAKKTLHSHINVAKNLSVQNDLTSAQRNSLISAIKVAEKAEAQYTNAKQFSDATLLLDAVVKSVKEDIANNGSTDKPSTNADKDKAYADLKNAMNTLNGFNDGFLATFAGQNFKAALQGQADALAAGTVSYKQISINILKAVDEATKANAKYEANNNGSEDTNTNETFAEQNAKATLAEAKKVLAGYSDAYKASANGKLFIQRLNIIAGQIAAAKNDTDYNNATDNLQAALKIANAGYAKFNEKQNNRFTGIAHINYAKGYGIQVWTKDHKIVRNADGSAKKLGGETNWKVFGPSVNIDGKNMYCVGGNQYVDAAYVTFTHSVNLNK